MTDPMNECDMVRGVGGEDDEAAMGVRDGVVEVRDGAQEVRDGAHGLGDEAVSNADIKKWIAKSKCGVTFNKLCQELEKHCAIQHPPLQNVIGRQQSGGGRNNKRGWKGIRKNDDDDDRYFAPVRPVSADDDDNDRYYAPARPFSPMSY